MSEDKSITFDTFNFDEFYNKLSPKEKFYYKKIDEYFKYCPKSYIKKMISIINGDSHISLRILDWFVTKYSDNHKIKYKYTNEGDCSYFNVHVSYEAQLKSFKKQYFDPFRRSCKFWYNYNPKHKDKVIYTTIGQLNFFKWALDNKILEYIEFNYDTLSNKMVNSNKEYKENKILKKSRLDTDTISTTAKSCGSYIKISISDTISNMEDGSVIIKLD